MYDIIVIGGGMIGSAAVRHLAEINQTIRIALIGPNEPKDRDSTDIFGSHYDEGRITRVIDPDPICAGLAKRSLNRYRSLEEKSGIKFYQEVGCMALSSKGSKYLADIKNNVESLDQPYEYFTRKDIHQKCPYLNVTPDMEAIYTGTDSGHISARNIVRAQQQVALQTGCDIIHGVVSDVIKCNDYYDIKVEDGGHHMAKNVLLCPGAFINCRNLLPGHMTSPTKMLTTSVLLIEVQPEVALGEMSDMPSILIKHDVIAPGNSQCYVLPPIKYPNGNYYLKIGLGNNPEFKKELKTSREIKDFFCGRRNTKPLEKNLRELTISLFPGLAKNPFHYEHCVTCQTPSGHVIVDMVTPQMGVAFGGCGYAAKSSDEIGYMAARMMLKGSWDYDIPADNFKMKVTKSKI